MFWKEYSDFNSCSADWRGTNDCPCGNCESRRKRAVAAAARARAEWEAARPEREARERAEAAIWAAEAKAAREADEARWAAERAEWNAARKRDQEARAAITAAEKAADALIVARCATVVAAPKGGKRHTVENFEFSGCQLHREVTDWSHGNRTRTFLVLPLEDGWTVSWENRKDGQHWCRSVASANGVEEIYPKDEEVIPAAQSAGVTHNPFAALGKR